MAGPNDDNFRGEKTDRLECLTECLSVHSRQTVYSRATRFACWIRFVHLIVAAVEFDFGAADFVALAFGFPNGSVVLLQARLVPKFSTPFGE